MPRIRVRGISKRFGGTQALNQVDLDLYPGQIHALLGENGAGKSTLIKILAGIHQPDQGTVLFSGEEVDLDAGTEHIAFIHQDLGLVDSMTVAENIALIAGYERIGGSGLISWSSVEDHAIEIMARLELDLDPSLLAAELGPADRSLVAITRALSGDFEVVVLDEPTASLPEADVARLFQALERMRALDVSILFVTHRIDEVFRLADRVTVLRDGERVFVEDVDRTNPDEVVGHIVGRSLDDMFIDPPQPSNSVLLELHSVITDEGTGPVTFTMLGGEILGLVGLRGAGQSSVGRAVFGDARLRSGQMTLAGGNHAPENVNTAMAAGVGLVSGKRFEEGLAPGLTVRENLFLNPAPQGRIFDPISRRRERYRCAIAMDKFDVRPRETERPIITLSGGNQQKVILGRWLEAGSRLLVLEEPTFGVDVGAKAHIYEILREMAGNGKGILLVSSDFDEVAGICSRVLVFNHGRIVAELSRSELTVEMITSLASGVMAGEDR